MQYVTKIIKCLFLPPFLVFGGKENKFFFKTQIQSKISPTALCRQRSERDVPKPGTTIKKVPLNSGKGSCIVAKCARVGIFFDGFSYLCR